MENKLVGEIVYVEESGGWVEGFECERRVEGVDGVKIAVLVYFFDYLCRYPSGGFGVADLELILFKITQGTYSDYIPQLCKWTSYCLSQNSPESIQEYLNTPSTQSHFLSLFNESTLLNQSQVSTDHDLFKQLSNSLNLTIFLNNSSTLSKHSFIHPDPTLILFINKSPPDHYQILYPQDLPSLYSHSTNFLNSANNQKPSKPPALKTLNRDCKLCENKYESYFFPCNCIICHVCIEENYFIKKNFNCPRCRSKLDQAQRTDVLEFIKLIQKQK